MNQYNSYYLYQQFEKRGSQDWLPCYPNIFSVDGDGTMPLVMKKENDPDCGYTGDTEPIYRWYPLPITTDYICDECPIVQYRWENMDPSTDYYCEGTTKYYKQIRQYSYDSGTTWYDVTPPEYQQGSVYEQQSTDCGYVPPIEPQYRTTSGTPYCEGYDKYVEVYSQVSYDGGITWSTTATTPTLVEHNSAQCGYIEPQYRWETAPQSDYMCSGSSKYYKQYYEVSYDNGLTWQHVEPEQTRRGSLIEEYSQDCGYYQKFYGTYSNGTTKRLECESGFNHMLTRGAVQVTGTSIVYAEVGDCVRVIDDYCFGDSTSLTSVTLTDRLTGINQSAFSGCTSLSSITIPSSVNTIAQWSFKGCTSLTGITIPKAVDGFIGVGAFGGCTGMTSLVFEQGSLLTRLANSCFSGCKSLTGVTIPSGVTRIDSAFGGCSSMSSVTFENGSQLEYLGHPDAGQPYGGWSFQNCSSLTGITIPSSVTWIGLSVFEGCRSLTSIDIPSGVTFIGNNAFYNCSGLTSITVNATTPPTLGTSVFDNTNNCPIYVPYNSVSAYKSATGWSAYSSRITSLEQHRTTSGTPYCTGYDKYVDVYSQVSYDGGTTWETTATTTTLVETYSEDCGYSPMPSNAKVRLSYINEDVYTAACDSNTTLVSGDTKPTGYTYSAITLAEIGDCVTSIGSNAFNGCYSLTSCTIPSGVTSIGYQAFIYCTGLTSVDIPNDATSIGDWAFNSCYSLTSVTIGSGVTSIGAGAFSNCADLTSIRVEATIPPTLGSSVFNGSTCPIYVPSGSVETYKSASGWSNYSSRIQAIP